MDQRVPAELLVLAPKQTPQDGADPIDQAGHAVVAMLHQAAHLSEENLQRAMSMAHGLSKASVAARSRTGLKAEFISFTPSTAPQRPPYWHHLGWKSSPCSQAGRERPM